jgi:hypothetical protein
MTDVMRIVVAYRPYFLVIYGLQMDSAAKVISVSIIPPD